MTAPRPWLGIKSANHRIKSDAPHSEADRTAKTALPTTRSTFSTGQEQALHTGSRYLFRALRLGVQANGSGSSNFLETDAFPVITFTSTRVEAAGEDRYIVTGDLTIKGNTRPVALQMTKLGEFNDPRMGHRIGYTGQATINRRDFGMSFNAMLDGRFVVSDDINIMLEGELVEQPEQSQQAEQTEPAGPTTDD
jgi:YceI-like domain